MKTISIQLPDVEASMLIKLKRTHKSYKYLQDLFVEQIRKEYHSAFEGRKGK